MNTTSPIRVLVLGDDRGITVATMKLLISQHLPILVSRTSDEQQVETSIRLLKDYDLPNLHDRPTDQYGRPCDVEPLWLARQRNKRARR